MAHKTFISYKYSESKDERDEIIEMLGDDATYYNGETSDSPDMSENEDSTIWKSLRDMIFPTSVTIVLLSRNIENSNWVHKEILYSIGRSTRGSKQSQPNRIIAVVKPDYLPVGEIASTITKKSDYIELNYTDFIKSPSEYINKAPKEQFAKDEFDKIDVQYGVKLDAKVQQDGFQDFWLSHVKKARYPKIKNDKKLLFEVSRGDMPRELFNSCEIYWKVRNYGLEARRRNNERGQIVKGIKTRTESADFSGDHFVEVYLVKFGVVIGRDRISVPIDTLNGISSIK